jgi:predicted aspartyl protease
MSLPFNSQHGLILVSAEVTGPSGNAILRLALDTGATGTTVNTGPLVALGYDPALAPNRVQVTTGSGIEFVPRIPLSRISALGQDRTNFHVLCHTLPPSAGVDGLLGLDFLRGNLLTLDFRNGRMELT